MWWEFLLLKQIDKATAERNWEAVNILFRALGKVWEEATS